MKRYIRHGIYCTESDSEYYDDIQEIGQEFTSENTSINSGRLPAVFNMVNFEPNTVNLDYGGGRFDNVAEYLTQYDVVNLVYDPYNRNAEHNKEVIRLIREHGGADTATCSNVLNVIKEPEVRLNVLQNIKKLVRPGGIVYITVYEGKGDAAEGPTKSGYQLNRKTADYMDEIQQVFPNAKRKGKLVVCTNSNSGVTSSTHIKSNRGENMKRYIKSSTNSRKVTAATEPISGYIRIYLTNLGKYNEGELIGKWVDLPVSDNFESALSEIGIGGNYEEWFISDYETDIPGLDINEYADIYELNSLAEQIQDMDEYQIIGFGLYRNHGYSIEDALERSEDIVVYPNCVDMTDVAYEYVDTIGGIEALGRDTLEMYFDYDSFGRDLGINGTFEYVQGDYIELTNV